PARLWDSYPRDVAGKFLRRGSFTGHRLRPVLDRVAHILVSVVLRTMQRKEHTARRDPARIASNRPNRQSRRACWELRFHAGEHLSERHNSRWGLPVQLRFFL